MNLFNKKIRPPPLPPPPVGNGKVVAVWVRDHRTGRLAQVWQDADGSKSS